MLASTRYKIVIIILGLFYGRAFAFDVPQFVVDVPAGHFAGVSDPCGTLADARRSAVDDVVRQILRSIGGMYEHRMVDSVSGPVRSVSHVMDDRLSSASTGLVIGVEQAIVESSCVKENGRYVYFVLVDYPNTRIAEMRRLSRGSHLIGNCNGHAVMVSETNGVAVTLSSADVVVRKVNRYAPFIRYCIWKVPEGSVERLSVPFEPVRVCDESAIVPVVFEFKKTVSDYLLGAEFEIEVVLRGVDEVGRAVSLRASNLRWLINCSK